MIRILRLASSDRALRGLGQRLLRAEFKFAQWKRAARLAQSCRAIAAVCWLFTATGAVAEYTDLIRAFYDLEVASYCGLVSDAVQVGFHRERNRIMTRDDISDEAMQQARMTAWKEAHLEWQNRGLGGFRGWCRTEGQAAAERFLTMPE